MPSCSLLVLSSPPEIHAARSERRQQRRDRCSKAAGEVWCCRRGRSACRRRWRPSRAPTTHWPCSPRRDGWPSASNARVGRTSPTNCAARAAAVCRTLRFDPGGGGRSRDTASVDPLASSWHRAASVVRRVPQSRPRRRCVGCDPVGASWMRALDRLRGSTADLEMRAGLSAIGADLSSVAVEIAIAIEKPSGAFTWAERTRANAVLVDSPEPTSPCPSWRRSHVSSVAD